MRKSRNEITCVLAMRSKTEETCIDENIDGREVGITRAISKGDNDDSLLCVNHLKMEQGLDRDLNHALGLSNIPE